MEVGARIKLKHDGALGTIESIEVRQSPDGSVTKMGHTVVAMDGGGYRTYLFLDDLMAEADPA
jgi:hypothetical protein